MLRQGGRVGNRGAVSMSIEELPNIDLDFHPDSLASSVPASSNRVVTLRFSIDHWEKLVPTLCSLRSSHVSAIALLKPSEAELDDEEYIPFFTLLYEWDQLLLHNFLELCGSWVPNEFLPSLRTEATMELKWFREWLSAISDPEIHKYPALPWRSFIRKTVRENYDFAKRFVELAQSPATEGNKQVMKDLLTGLLIKKKKVLCVFPKNWGRSN